MSWKFDKSLAPVFVDHARKHIPDYDKVIEYAQHDDRLGYSHWNVPGPDGDFGYGGHCFPKDVKALTHLVDHSILNYVVKVNQTLLTKEVENGKTNN